MKKYMMLAIVPILLQSSAFAGDVAAHMQEAKNSINQAIMPQLQLAQIAMNSTISLDFDSIAPALVLFAKKARNNKPVAISNMQYIKKALELFEAQEKKKISYYSWLMGSSVLIKQVKVQIAYIDKALADLGVKKGSSTSIGAILGYASLATIAVVGAVGIGYEIKAQFMFNEMDNVLPFTKENVANRWADIVASSFFSEPRKRKDLADNLCRILKNDFDQIDFDKLNKNDKNQYDSKYSFDFKKNFYTTVFQLFFSGGSFVSEQEDPISFKDDRAEAYDALGLTNNATQDAIKAAYKKLVLQYHPDRNPEGAERFVNINAAYKLLVTE